MAISFDETTTGTLPDIWEELMEAIDDINVWRNTTLGTLIDAIATSFNASSHQELIGGLYQQRDAARTALNGLVSYLAGLVKSIAIEVAHADNPLNQKTINYAADEIISQMIGSGSLANPDEDFDAPAVTATVAADSGNTGDAMVVASVRITDGRLNEHAFAEVMDVICTKDSYSGGITAGRGETWSIKGEAAASSRFAYNWPQGSGASGTLGTTDASQENTAATPGNLLANSDFEDFDDTANVPDEWTLFPGTAGTNCLEENATVYKGSSAVEFVGDASNTETRLVQTFAYNGSNGNNRSTLKPNTVYHFAAKVGKGAGITDGSWKVGIADSTGTYLTDDAGNELSATIAHGDIAAAGSWTTFSGYFVTPKVFTSRPQFMIETPNAADISDGHSLFIDHLSLVEAKKIYTGLYVSVHSGATNTLKEDTYTVTIANDLAGKYQHFLNLCLDMLSLEKQFPSDSGGTESIADWS